MNLYEFKGVKAFAMPWVQYASKTSKKKFFELSRFYDAGEDLYDLIASGKATRQIVLQHARAGLIYMYRVPLPVGTVEGLRKGFDERVADAKAAGTLLDMMAENCRRNSGLGIASYADWKIPPYQTRA